MQLEAWRRSSRVLWSPFLRLVTRVNPYQMPYFNGYGGYGKAMVKSTSRRGRPMAVFHPKIGDPVVGLMRLGDGAQVGELYGA